MGQSEYTTRGLALIEMQYEKKKLKPKWNNYIVNVQISNTKLLCGCKEHSLGDKRIHSCIMGSGEHLNINTWKIEEQAAGSLQGPCI